jgi:hypothetical protein
MRPLSGVLSLVAALAIVPAYASDAQRCHHWPRALRPPGDDPVEFFVAASVACTTSPLARQTITGPERKPPRMVHFVTREPRQSSSAG